MKVTKVQLKQIIKEELEAVLSERGIQAYAPGFPVSPHDQEPHDEEVDISGNQEALAEAEGKGCAESEGGSGCIKKRGDQWVILNNKKGGVWRKCDSEAHCEEILDAFHASRG